MSVLPKINEESDDLKQSGVHLENENEPQTKAVRFYSEIILFI